MSPAAATRLRNRKPLRKAATRLRRLAEASRNMQHIGSLHLFRRDSRLKMAQNPKPADAAAPRLGKPLKRSFFDRSVHEVAPDLIGATLLVDGVGGIIAEVEAYHHTDPAAHSYQRADAAQPGDVRPAGLCLCLPLLRHPLVRQFRLRRRRLGQRRADPRDCSRPTACPRCAAAAACTEERALCSGPGKLCEALGITIKHSALPLDQPPFALHARTANPRSSTGVRIGITKAVESAVAIRVEGSRFLSKPF